MMVYLVEDAPVIRERLRDMIMELDHNTEVYEATTALEAIAGIVEKQPELVVLDLKLEQGNGLDVLRVVKEKRPASRVVVFTNQASQPYRKKCMAMGATDFFDKTHDFAKVRDIVRQTNSTTKAATDNGEKR
jgi:DNA-binding NarL/FixJ family response regulator